MSFIRMVRRSPKCALSSLLLAPLLAHAGTEGTLETTVTTISNNVTYSSAATSRYPALVTTIGYEVLIANVGGNTSNHIVFTGNTSDEREPRHLAVFSSAEGASCEATNAEGTAIACAIGQLKAGEAAPAFRVFFTAPIRLPDAAVGPGSVDGGSCTGDCVAFSGTTYYAEGTGGVPQSTPLNSTVDWSAAEVALGTTNPTNVKSVVTKNGGSYFTNIGGVGDSTTPLATTVTVPPGPASTTAEISQSPFAEGEDCSNFYSCSTATITAPVPSGATRFDPYLTIILRMAATNIRPGTKIGQVEVYYVSEPGATPIQIGQCASPTTPRSDGIPCWAAKKTYPNNYKPNPDLSGAFEWTLLNIVNGTYRLP